MGITHQMIALLATLWFLIQYPIQLGPLFGILALIAVMIGALTPDIDQPTANIWKKFIGGRTTGNIMRALFGGHRHLTHSIIGILLIGKLTHWIATSLIHPAYTEHAFIIWIAFMIGYISHPIADTLTDNGVPWFWPLKVHIKIPPGPEELRVTTNSFVERIIVRGGVIAATVLLLSNHWQTIIRVFI